MIDLGGNQYDSKRLVKAALSGEGPTRPAVGPLAVHYCAQVAGVTVREYTTDAQVLADCVVKYYERFRPDAVWLSADTWVTAEAMGAAVDFPADNQPLCGTGAPLIQTAADIQRLPSPDVTSQGRLPLMVEALRRVHETIGEDVYIVACLDQYPFSLACALMGMERMMLTLTEDPAIVEALLDRCLEFGVAYGKALTDAGADMLSGGDSPAGLIGPRYYRQFALTFEQRMIAAIKAHADIPVSLHICGDSSPVLGDMAKSGADVLEIDHQIDIAMACESVGPEIALWGNIDPVSMLLQGTSHRVRTVTRELIETFARCQHRRYVVSSGCTLAMHTPAENLEAMLAVAHEFS